MNPRTAAAAYLIWHDCKEHGWDRTIPDIANSVDRSDISVQRARRVIEVMGWMPRVRRVATDNPRDTPPLNVLMDEELDGRSAEHALAQLISAA